MVENSGDNSVVFGRRVSLTLSLYQGESRGGEIEENLALIHSVAVEARRVGSDLLVFPEGFLTGYYQTGDLRAIAARVTAEVLARLQGIADVLALGLVIGSYIAVGDAAGGAAVAAAGGQLYNGAWLFLPQQREARRYYKQRLYGEWEQQNFRAGSSPLVFDYCDHRFGVVICYDIEFPEVVAPLVALGCETILVPTALMAPYSEIALELVPRMAREHRVGIAYANRVGRELELEFVGLSRVVDKNGVVVSAAAGAEIGLVTARIDT